MNEKVAKALVEDKTMSKLCKLWRSVANGIHGKYHWYFFLPNGNRERNDSFISASIKSGNFFLS